MKIRQITLSITFVLIAKLTMGQFVMENTIDVIENGNLLSMPWAGGINSSQVNMMDIDNDGLEDLILYERTLGKIKVYKAVNDNWEYRPEWAALFPLIENWMLLRDFNGDGKKDIFTHHPLGVKVFVNISAQGNVTWRPFNNGSALLTNSENFEVNIPVEADDLPSIEDIDGDGKLDILNFGFFSGSIEYHRNEAMTSDTLVFVKLTDNWGDFEECQCGIYAFDGKSCSELGGRTEHNRSKTLLAIDRDGDGDKDLAIGESDCTRVFYLENVGNSESAILRDPESVFSSTSGQANVFIFPASYYEDIDHDGDKDMIVTTHTKSNEAYLMNFRNNVLFFENLGTTEQPDLIYRRRDYLHSDMIDVGENAHPVFIDMDNDGDKEMIVGRFSDIIFSGRIASLYLYENTGSPEEPVFELYTDNYLALSIRTFFNIRPQIADINQDKNPDLVFSANSLNEGFARIYYILNPSFWRFGLDPFAIQATDMTLLLNEKFHLADSDADGDLDLFVSRINGQIQYFKNNGGFSSEGFELVTEFFRDIKGPQFGGIANMETGDIDQDGELDMLLGWANGEISLYKSIFTDLESPAIAEDIILKIPDGDDLTSSNLGTNLRLHPVNLFNEDKPALAVGTGQGGLYIFRNEDAQPFISTGNFDISPTIITEESEFVRLDASRNAILEFYTSSGQLVKGPFKVNSTEDFRLMTQGLSSGLYIVRIYYDDGQFLSRKFVIAK